MSIFRLIFIKTRRALLVLPFLGILLLGFGTPPSAAGATPAAECAPLTLNTSSVRFLTLDEVLAIHTAEIEEDGVGLDRIRDQGVLESAIAQPQASFGGVDLHPSIFEKAATYAFAIAEAQAFIDGNKRTGAMAAIRFLELNGYKSRRQNAETILHNALVEIAGKKISRNDLTNLIERLFNKPAKRFRYVTKEKALRILSRELRDAGGQIEGTRDMGAFLSALSQPQASFAGEDLYPSAYDKAAAYLFFISEAQAFLNGNKRLAIAVALEFLSLNGIQTNRLIADPILKKALLDIAEKRISLKDLGGILEQLTLARAS